ncbi:DUF3383 family protein, partial [Enterobacter hormaechei]|uniref:DUF3383 family protein n=1 Tax=Enterobacter hormaechei TaxID=158836 RepID=UPI000FCB7B45
TSLSDDDVISVAAFIQSDDVSRIFGYTTQNTGVLDLDNENDIASKLKNAKYGRTFIQYSTSLSDDDVISVAAFIQSDDVSRIFGYTTQNTGV